MASNSSFRKDPKKSGHVSESERYNLSNLGEVTEYGRLCLPAKEVSAQVDRGFKSHPLRKTRNPLRQQLERVSAFSRRTLASRIYVEALDAIGQDCNRKRVRPVGSGVCGPGPPGLQ